MYTNIGDKASFAFFCPRTHQVVLIDLLDRQSLIFLGILGAEAEAGHKVARCPPEKLMSCLCKECKLCCFDETLLECSRQGEHDTQVRWVYV